MHTLLILMFIVLGLAALCGFAWLLDWFFGEALPAGSADDALDISDSQLDEAFDGDHS